MTGLDTGKPTRNLQPHGCRSGGAREPDRSFVLRAQRRDATRHRLADPRPRALGQRPRPAVSDQPHRSAEARRGVGRRRARLEAPQRTRATRARRDRTAAQRPPTSRRARSVVAGPPRTLRGRPQRNHRKGSRMTVCSVDKNAEAKTMVITAEFTASITHVWQLWADPRLLERWWGPPGFPATFEQHDLT